MLLDDELAWLACTTDGRFGVSANLRGLVRMRDGSQAAPSDEIFEAFFSSP